MTEIWKPIKDFESQYLVSNLGNIRHVNSEKNRVLCKDKAGYLRVSFRVKGYQQSTHIVHRLVAKAFLETIKDHNEVNHIDGNKTNNCVTNLEWSNRVKNIQHSFDIGLQIPLKGEDIGNSKLKQEEVLEIRRLLTQGITQTVLAKIYKVHQGTISNIKLKHIWKHI